jgi:hypothetical protein
MRSKAIEQSLTIAAMLAAALVAIAGCHSKAVDKEAFRSAINRYYTDRQDCLFEPEIKFPVQADAGDDDETRRFDALVDAGLLERTPEEKKRFLIGSKQVNDYDLSAEGRTHWTADANQPGSGNFCLGSPAVQSIDNFVPAGTSDKQYSVTYTYALKPPTWASNAEIGTAFPRIAQEVSGQSAIATLTRQGDEWQVGNVTSSSGTPLPQ